MSKERRTVSLDPEVEEYLERDGVNASQLVNRLVESHFTMGGDKQAMLEMREQQIESDIEELQSRMRTKEQELEKVQRQLEELTHVDVDKIREAAETIPDTVTSPDNIAVQNWAENVGISAEELLERMEEYR